MRSHYGLNRANPDVYIATCMPELYTVRTSKDNYNRIHTNYRVAISSHTHLAMTQVLYE